MVKGLIRGWAGEKKAALSLWASLDNNVYKRFHNLIIPSENGTTQIDHLIVSEFGLFIVETKNKGGWIFGSEGQSKWTQTISGKKYSFQNPLHQAFRQKKVLSAFLGIDESLIRIVVYFAGNCKFKTQLPENVVKSNPGGHIKRFNVPLISDTTIYRIGNEISALRSQSSLTNADHVRSLKDRHTSTTTCPKCGSSLVERVAKKGPNAGKKFLGCDAYPKCRFTRESR